jgi:hypothetical protein
VRPPWIDSDNDAERGVELTRAMFAVEVKDPETGLMVKVPRLPTDKDRWRWAGACSPDTIARLDAAADARAQSYAERRRQAEEALLARNEVRNVPASKERLETADYSMV